MTATMRQETLDKFTFHEPDGSDPLFEMGFQDVGLRMRLSKAGRRVLCFPAPYDGLEIAEDEHVSVPKYERIKAALAHLMAVNNTPNAESAIPTDGSHGNAGNPTT